MAPEFSLFTKPLMALPWGTSWDPVYVPRIVSSFFPLDGTRNCYGVSEPLLAVQVTELVDDIFIGCTMNHVVADGTSFWHFFNSWSGISRGSNKIFLSPVFKRWFMPHTHFPIRIPQSALVFGRPPSSPTQERVMGTNEKGKNFHFTNEKIAMLKVRGNVEMGTNEIFSLQALLAHLCMYFGVAIQPGFTTMKADGLLGQGLGHAAWQMNRMIATYTYTEAEATNFLESWVKNPKPFPPRNTTTNDILYMTGSHWFNVYGTDFGWGSPVAVRCGGGNRYDGRTTSSQGAEEVSNEH
ncbi:hypothetical protein PVL29_026934 [Vitis rotundifolia]|uniref:Acetyltransferase n=1 Tax=Vitis rotundifolia TaxID=103349 RepID=A0AA38YHV3_VITRO|nr:hypothetical protein PVL29_026934 [Vitis rotundifolia]